jgi:O-antigen ligase
MAVLFFALLLLGGGGAPAPIVQAILQALALGGLLGLVWLHLFYNPITASIRWSGLFIIVILLIPVSQLIPLPFEIWRSLPGRELAAHALDLAGVPPHPRPISLDPEATRFTALSLLPGVVIFLAVAALDHNSRILLIKIALAVGAVSAVLGAVQFTMAGSGGFYVFPRSGAGRASGLFANANFQSDFMLLCILLAAYIARTQPGQLRFRFRRVERQLHIAMLLIPFCAFMTLAAQSRTGVLLLPVVLLAAYWILLNGAKKSHLIGAAAFIGLAAGVLFVAAPTFALAVINRFGSGPEERIAAVPDIWHAIKLYFPFGSGLGTFDPVYRSVESLSVVKETYLNHAHDDYLEILLETGAFGIAAVAVFWIAFVARCLQIFRAPRGSEQMGLQRVSAVGIALLLVHSVADYPLRTITLLSMFAFFCAILFTDDLGHRERKTSRSKPRRRKSERDGRDIPAFSGGNGDSASPGGDR